MKVRTFCSPKLAILVTTIFTMVTTHAHGQTLTQRKKSANQTQRTAVLLLDSAIDELREIEDIEARASLAESIVKLLAKKKPERCRQMLNSLFAEALRIRKESSDSNDPAGLDLDPTMRKIIQIAASYDRQLAQSFIKKYTAEEDRKENTTRPDSQTKVSVAELQLKVATELFERDSVLALAVAERAINIVVPPEALTFLGKLRKKDVRLADRFFAQALGGVMARGGADVNELLVLYAYVFSPLQVPRVRPEGLALIQMPDYLRIAENYPINPQLGRLYLETTVQIVTSSSRYDPSNPNQVIFDAAGDIFLINIIEPHVANYLPSLTQSLLTQRYLATNYLQPEQRARSQEQLDRWNDLHSRANQLSENRLESVDYFTEWAERTSDPKRKSQLYFRAAALAVREKKFDAALGIVEKLPLEYRDQAKQFIMFQVAEQSARDGQFEKAEQWIRQDGDLVRRAYILTLLSDALSDGKNRDIGRTSELLNEVEQLSRKFDKEEEKAVVLFGAAAVYSRFDPARAFDLLGEAIKAANKVEKFTTDTTINRVLDIGGFKFFYPMYSHDLTPSEAINRLGLINFNATLSEMHNLKNRLPRLLALVALCNTAFAVRSSDKVPV